ncbi:MAG: AmmeMemoRadiSam system protein B [Planctomycetes bacterium]|nr:AmmeMemoRadiSam system protein B [Planctomycetota bacterium]
MNTVRKPAVAGLFYPADPTRLRHQVQAYLDQAAAGAGRDAGSEGATPKALIVPHAGYTYSGPPAAAAYVRLAGARTRISRVVLIGPAHRVPLHGFAVSAATAFATPLGDVPVDRATVRALLALPLVREDETAHAEEHCLEVQLPFLQLVLDAFTIVPLVAGEAAPAETARVLDLVWGGPETLIVVSSDLSHYRDDETARRLDRTTADAIETLRPEALVRGTACGRVPIAGLLHAARARGLAVETAALQNSGAVTGDRREVVGYGAFVFAAAPPESG